MIDKVYYRKFFRYFCILKKEHSGHYVTDEKCKKSKKGPVRKLSNYFKTTSKLLIFVCYA